MRDGDEVAFGVLGPLSVHHPSGPVMMGGRSERAVLARLLLVPGAPVSIDELVDGLWRQSPPPTAERTLQSYLSRWRSRLRPVELRRTGTGSYVLDVSDSRVDATDFRALVTAAHRVASGDPRRAIEHYDDALRRWRGPPFAELEEWPSVAPVVRGLEELRNGALEERAQLRLDLFEHAELVADLEQLVEAEPLRERRWAQLMLALARSGRFTEALRAFQRARHLLAEEAGLDPGPDLVDLERRIVARDPELVGVPTRPAPRADGATHPTTRLVGREREVRELDRAVRAAEAGQGGAWLVTGVKGVGKTRLVSEVGEQARQRDVRVVWGRCWPHGDAPPYWPWTAVLGELSGEPLPAAVTDGDRFTFVRAAFERLVAAANRRPLVVVLDDVHAADPDALFLAGYVARAAAGLPLLLVATATTPAGDVGAARPLAADAGGVLELRGLTPAATAAHALELGRELDDDTAASLAALTGGIPARLQRAVLAVDADGPAGADVIDAAADAAVAALPAKERRALGRIAVLGDAAAHRDALAVLDDDTTALATMLAAAVDAGVVRVDGVGTVAFVHPHARARALASLGAVEMLDAAAAARDVLRGSGDPTASVRHASLALDAAARSRSDAAEAVAAVREAARHLRCQLRHREAMALLDRAVTTARAVAPDLVDADLLADRAEAAWAAGRLADQRRAADEYLAVAEAGADARALAHAAVLAAGFWVEDVRDQLDKRRVMAAQWRALDALAAQDPAAPGPDPRALALRLRLRLAAEEVDWFGADLAVLDAVVDEARQSDDAVVRCDALGLAANCTMASGPSERRLRYADELVATATAAGLSTYAVWGLTMATAERFKGVDPGAMRQLRLLLAHADAIDNASLRYVARVLHTMTLVREGRLDEADVAVEACLALGAGDAGDPDAFIYYGAHLVVLRWLQGREDETLALFRQVVDSPDLATTDLTAVGACAALAARSGASDLARVYFDRLVRDGLDSLPRSSNFLAMLVGVVEAAYQLGEVAAARHAYDLMAPFADVPIMPSLAVVCFGSAHRWLGLAAATFGDADLAVQHLERAVADNLRFGNVPVAHICRVDLAQALARRGAPGDVAAAAELVRTAAAGADALGMTVLAGRWRDALAEAPLVSG